MWRKKSHFRSGGLILGYGKSIKVYKGRFPPLLLRLAPIAVIISFFA